MTMRTKLLTLVVATLGLAQVSFAAELKIGVVDVARIMQNLPQKQAVQDKLQNEFNLRRDEIMKLGKDIQKEEESLKRDQAVLSADQLQQSERAIYDKKLQFKRLKQAYQEDAGRREQEEIQKLLQKVGKIVDELAKSGQYDIVLRREAAPFYVSNKVDMTPAVLEAFKKGS